MSKRIGDGRSVKVYVPAGNEIGAGEFVLLDGYLGLAVYSIKTDNEGNVVKFKGQQVTGGRAPEIMLRIEEARYETSQIDSSMVYSAGDKVYWEALFKRFTRTAPGNRYAGRVVDADNNNGIIWFKLTPDGKEPLTITGHVTFNLKGTLDTDHKVDGFKFNVPVTIKKVRARVETLPGEAAALAFNVKNEDNDLFAEDCVIASTDTAFAFKEFTPINAGFIASDVLSVVINNPGDTAAADMEIVIEYEYLI